MPGVDWKAGFRLNRFAISANRRRRSTRRWGVPIVGTLILLFVVDKIMGLRVTPEQEVAGLDLSQHGEEGYDLGS